MKTPIKLDSYGSRKRFYSKLYGAEPLLSSSIVANVFILAMTACDFFTNYSMWNLVLSTQLLIKYMITFSTAALLDLPMGIAANALKQWKQGMRSKNEAVIINVLAIAAFLMVLTMTSIVRINARDLCFPDIEEDRIMMLVAVAISFLPAATSLGVYAVSYACADPKRDRLKRLGRLKCSMEARIADIDAANMQAEFADGYVDSKKKIEDALHNAHLDSIDAQEREIEQYSALEVMMKVAASGDQISTVTSRSQNLLTDQTKGEPVNIA